MLAWIPGQGVKVDHAAIVEILIDQLHPSRESRCYVPPITSFNCFAEDEIQQTTALGWIAKFLEFAPEVMVPFTPRLIPAILPNLAHHIPAMQSAAAQTNQKLFALIQSLPSPPMTTGHGLPSSSAQSLRNVPSSPQIPNTARTIKDVPSLNLTESSAPSTAPSENLEKQPTKLRTSTLPFDAVSTASGPATESQGPTSRPHSPLSAVPSAFPEEADPFDYQVTVTNLTFQFLSEHEETRVYALKWLIMLHQKAPKKVGHTPTFFYLRQLTL